MKKTILILCVALIALALISCGQKSTDGPITFDEEDYIPVPTEEEQVEQSLSDKQYYEQAKEERNPELCEKIEFTTMRNLCLEKVTP